MFRKKAQAVLKSVSEKVPFNGSKPMIQKLKGRDLFLLSCLEEAIAQLHKKLGDDLNKWQYGQTAYHHVVIKHPLSNAVNDSIRAILETGILPRGGNGSTPGVTSNSDNQSHGATFKMVADVLHWIKLYLSICQAKVEIRQALSIKIFLRFGRTTNTSLFTSAKKKLFNQPGKK